MELKVFFKNVGQGDTIVCEWNDDDGKPMYGLIDCNLVNNEINALIQHIKGNEFQEKEMRIQQFEFVIMTHPHSDHFSGFPTLFKYCSENNIKIKRFLHTAIFDPEFLRQFSRKVTDMQFEDIITSPVNFSSHKSKLKLLYDILDEQVDDDDPFIESVEVVTGELEITLNSNLRLKFLAPNIYYEIKEYFKKSFNLKQINRGKKIKLENKHENNPYANYFSTLIQIFDIKSDWQLLLCSDITKYTLYNKLSKKIKFNAIRNKNLLAVQIPHHGSKKNHDGKFWQQVKELRQSHVLISVGEGYGHPHIDVVSYFKKNAKSFHVTNNVGGFHNYHSANKKTYSKKQNKIIEIDNALSIAGVGALNSDEVCGEKMIYVFVDENKQVHCEIENI